MVITTVGQGVRTRLVDRGASRGPASLHHVDLAEVSQIYLAAAAFTEEPLASAVETLLAAARDWKLPVVVGGPSSADLEALGADEFLELVRTLQPDAVGHDHLAGSVVDIRETGSVLDEDTKHVREPGDEGPDRDRTSLAGHWAGDRHQTIGDLARSVDRLVRCSDPVDVLLGRIQQPELKTDRGEEVVRVVGDRTEAQAFDDDPPGHAGRHRAHVDPSAECAGG